MRCFMTKKLWIFVCALSLFVSASQTMQWADEVAVFERHVCDIVRGRGAVKDLKPFAKKTNFDPNMRDNRTGDRLLHLAIRRGHVPIFMWLLRQPDIDPRLTGRCEESPLHTVAQRGDPRMVNALLLMTPPDVRDGGNRTPLYYACREGHPRVAEELLGAGADPCAEVLDDKGMLDTPARVATRAGHKRVQALILGHILGREVDVMGYADVRREFRRNPAIADDSWYVPQMAE